MTVTSNSLKFNKATDVELNYAPYIKVLLNAKTRQIAIQPCSEKDPNAIKFSNEESKQTYAISIKVPAIQVEFRRMLPFEDEVAAYIKETDNHVMYRVTPVFEGSNLVASGVLMEAYSVEDQGKGICFCTYCYNVQPGVAIDYATGDSHLSGKNNQNSHNSSAKEHASAVYILNTNTKKFHKPDCHSVKQMSSKNRKKYKGLRKKLIKDGYSPCKNCNP